MKPVKTVCHRGANKVAPENTFAAAQAALALGGDIIEFDVRQSADDVHFTSYMTSWWTGPRMPSAPSLK